MNNFLLIDSTAGRWSLVAETLAALTGADWSATVLCRQAAAYQASHSASFQVELTSGQWGPKQQFALWRRWRRQNINKLLLAGATEKIKLTKRAYRWRLRPIWLEAPADPLVLPVNIRAALDNLAPLAEVVCLTGAVREARLAAGWPADHLHCLPCGLRLPAADDAAVWPSLASSAKRWAADLVIGAVTDLSETQKVEELFSLVKSCAEIGLVIQLIVVGEGQERVKLAWLAKKMGIENQIWLVGERGHLQKWYGFFDLLMIASRQPDLADLRVALGALAAGVAILATASEAMSDCLLDGQTGQWVDLTDIEQVASQLKTLHLDRPRLKQLGRAGQQLFNDFFAFDVRLKAWRQFIYG